MSNYLPVAQRARSIVSRLLTERGLQPPAKWLLAERNGYAWLIGVLPTLPKLAPYIEPDVTHSLQTALGGRSVIISNSTGMRYAILLSARPKLPQQAAFPDAMPDQNVFHFGVGLRGVVTARADEWMHMIIAGAPGSGKSTFLRSLAHTARHHGWSLFLCDPDGHTFPEAWNEAAALPVASSGDELLTLIERIEAEIARRAALFQEVGRTRGGRPPENIDEYNQTTSEPLPRAMLMIDEANGYLGDKKIEKGLAEIARRGRKWGIHLILSGHNWRAKDVSRELSAMLVTRVCFRVADDTSGDVVLYSHRWGQYAMKIGHPGRAVLILGTETQPVQTYQISREQEERLLGAPVELLSPLTEKERLMVKTAIEQLNDLFPVSKLAKALNGVVSEWEIRKTAEAWERRGWLTKPADAVSARQVTPELARLAGFSG